MGAQDADGVSWHEILTEAAPLEELVVFGCGKRAGFEVSLADGRRLSMGAGDVSVSLAGEARVKFERVDDVNVKIRYSGPGLEVRSFRIRFGDRRWQDEFSADVHEWLADGMDDDLGYCVDAEITLAPAQRRLERESLRNIVAGPASGVGGGAWGGGSRRYG